MPTNITTDGRCSSTAHSCNENAWVPTTSAFFKGAFSFRIHADVCTSLCRRITKDIQDTTMFAIADHCVLMRQINLSWCWDVSNDGLAALVQNVPSLLLLNCTGIKRLTDTPFLSAAELMPDLRVSILLHFLHRSALAFLLLRLLLLLLLLVPTLLHLLLYNSILFLCNKPLFFHPNKGVCCQECKQHIRRVT